MIDQNQRDTTRYHTESRGDLSRGIYSRQWTPGDDRKVTHSIRDLRSVHLNKKGGIFYVMFKYISSSNNKRVQNWIHTLKP